MLIDVNTFFGHWPYWQLPQTSGDDVLRLMDRYGIDQAMITSTRGLHGDWQEANAETLALTQLHPDRLTPVACMSPMKGGGGKALKELVAKGFRGIRLYPLLMHGYSLRSSFVDEVCVAAGELKVPVYIPTRPMMNYRFSTLPIEDIANLAQRHSGTSFILSGANYLLEFRNAIEALRRCGNMVIEISCMQGFQAVAGMVEAVGADRVLFGTGSLLHYPACNIAKFEHANISESQRQLVASQNAIKLFGLGV